VQFEALGDPKRVEYVPGMQSVQLLCDVAPNSVEYVPGLQDIHEIESEEPNVVE